MQLSTVQNQIKNTKFDLATIASFGDTNITMGTKEIADMLSIEHRNLKVSAERLFERGVIGKGSAALQRSSFTNEQNREFAEYRLNKRDSMTLVAQNCPEFTGELVDRWLELEQGNNAGAITMTMNSSQLRLLSCEVEKKEKAIAYIESVKPKVEFVEKFTAEGKQLQNATTLAKSYGYASAAKLNEALMEHGVYNRTCTKAKVFNEWFIKQGFGKMVQSDQFGQRALFTNAGAYKVGELLGKVTAGTMLSEI